MKYTLLFAATAAAYDAYGGYGAQSSSTPSKPSSTPGYGYDYDYKPSTPVKPSSTPGYGYDYDYKPSTSIKPSSTPGYGYDNKPSTSVKTSTPPAKYTPCVITPGYGKPPVTVTSQYQAYPTCVVKGYDGKSCDKWEDNKYVSTTITDYNKKVVTITKVQDYVTVYHEKKTITRYATPTAKGYGAVSTPVSKNSTGVWYELYEIIKTCEYQNIGKNLIVGWTGPGLCQKCDYEQPIVVKEYKDGKWTETKKTVTYGKPQDEVKVYEKTGVYTIPGKTVTVNYPVTYIDKATTTAKAGETCIYGGQYVDVKSTGTITGVYGAVETKVVDSKTVTVTVTKTATVYCGRVGKCELSPKTTTVYKVGTVIVYPTGKVYQAGVYKYTPKVVTITKPNQPYTCKYEQPKQTPSKTPAKNEYPSQVTKTPTYNNDYGYKASSTPTPKYPSNEYPSYPSNSSSSSKPVYDDYKPSSTPGYETPKSTPSYDDNYKPSSTPGYYEAPKSTPPAYETPKSTPSYEAPKSTPPAYETPKSTPSYDDNYKPSSTPSYEAPKSTPPAYEAPKSTPPADYEVPKSTPTPGYEAPKSTPPSNYEAPKSTPPADYEAPKSTPPSNYEAPKSTPPAYEAPKPTPTPYVAPGYTKRGSLAERRNKIAL